MSMRKIIVTSLLGAALAMGACDKGEGKADGKTADAKGKTDAATKEAGKTPAGDGADGGETPEAQEAALDDRVIKAASLAAKIEADPSKAEEVLAAEGLTREAFDELIYQVSQPGLAEQYRLARARGEG